MRLRPNRHAVPADAAPDDPVLTPYDIEHIVTYLRVLDANAEGADWREVSQIVLRIDPETEPARAKRSHESHLVRAQWMMQTGYRLLLRGDIPSLNWLANGPRSELLTPARCARRESNAPGPRAG